MSESILIAPPSAIVLVDCFELDFTKLFVNIPEISSTMASVLILIAPPAPVTKSIFASPET